MAGGRRSRTDIFQEYFDFDDLTELRLPAAFGQESEDLRIQIDKPE